MFLKQSTAVTLSLGPFVDDSDGKTAETGLSLTVYLSKNGAAAVARNSGSAVSHDRDGYYRVPLDATDTAASGLLRVFASPAGALPVWRDGVVLPAAVYDALIGGNATLPVATGAIADAVWDEALAGHLAVGSAGTALNNSGGAAADPWATALPGAYAGGTAGWILGSRLDAKVSAVGGASPGAGAVEVVYGLTDSDTGDPIPDADVWVTTDTAGQHVVADGRTNQTGAVTFYLDAGPVYVWRQKSGWNFANPDAIVVA